VYVQTIRDSGGSSVNLDPRESHTTKVLYGFAVVILVVAALGTYTVVQLDDVVREERTEAITNEADAVDDTVEAILFGMEKSAVTLADETVRIRDSDELSASAQTELNDLYRTQTDSREIGTVHLADGGTGEVLASSDSSAVGEPVSGFGFSPPDDLTVGETHLEFYAGGNDNTASWVVYSPTEAGNVLVQVTPYSFVESELEGTIDESRVRIVNADGTVVFDGESTAAVGGQHTAGEGVSSPAVQAALDGNSGATRVSGEQSPTGGEVVVGYNDQIGSTGWAAVAYAEPSALFAAIDTVQRNLFLLLGGVVVALFGFGLVVERPAVGELGRLRERVGGLERGELDEAVETERRDEFGDLARGLESMRTELRDQITEARRAQNDAEEARQEAEALSSHLEAKAEEYRRAIRTLADGDFTVEVDAESRHDGMAEIGETLDEVIDDLAGTIADVQRFADEVADSMRTLSASASEVETATADVSQTVQSISTGTTEQQERLQSVVEEMNDMSATVEEIASTSGEVAASADTAAELSREGRETASEASTALDEIEATTGEAVEEVETLVEQVGRIEEFADVIGDIAEQTDMLALNANVEAARTDTDADGFAVVADEIKSLAAEAGDRADDIETLVGDVAAQTDETADRMRETNRRLRESNETVESAIDGLIEIGETVESTNEGIQEIDRATDDQATTTEEVTATVEQVEEIATQNATEAEDAAAATEQQAATVSQVAQTADRIAEEAETLRETADQFTVAHDRATDDGRAADDEQTRVTPTVNRGRGDD
jgi:methyl-accepting chemotaxis protein